MAKKVSINDGICDGIPLKHKSFEIKAMARGRIELPTRGFSVLCSAN
jgi:hypothetical protein